MKWLHTVAFVLVAIGAVNWGLIGLGAFMSTNWNVVGMILGSWPQVEWLVYVLVGAAGVYEVVSHKWRCKECSM